MHKLSDQELWESIRKDNMRAYNELFDRYAASLYKQAIRFIKETAVAEELVMDLLFDLWQKRVQTVITGEIAPYIFRSMRNRVLNHLRRKITLTTSVDLLTEDELVENRQADYHVMQSDAEMVLLAKLQELSPQRRKAFLLSREDNLSYSEIAKEMNLSVNTVENYMVAALNTLRQSTKEYTVLAIGTLIAVCSMFN